MTKKALVVAADGYEDVELVAVLDVLNRVGVEVFFAGLTHTTLKGAYGTTLIAHGSLSDVTDASEFDAVIVPGGKKNAIALSEDKRLLSVIRERCASGKIVAAICAAPSHVLVAANVVSGRSVTGDSTFNQKLEAGGGILSHQAVTVDGNLITGTGPGSALAFAIAVAEALVGEAPLVSFREKWGIIA